MTAQEFRSEMIERIRAFDRWAYKDQIVSPEDYSDYEFQEWFELFEDWLSGNS
jgi:hypothetical protein